MHIMAQNVGNDDTQDIYELYGFWIGMLFAIVKKHFFAFYRDLWGRVRARRKFFKIFFKIWGAEKN